MQPVENATIRDEGKACAISAGTCAFIAQVSERSPSAPNLRPAMKTMLGAFGSAWIAVSSIRSQLIVSTPRACSQSLTPASLKRATPMTRRSGAAALASPASVGPILPATPRIMMSPSTGARSSINAWVGRHRRSSSAAISGMVFGRFWRVRSMVVVPGLSFAVSSWCCVTDHEHAFEDEHEAVKGDAAQRQQHDGHHHRGRVERRLHLDHEVAEPALGGDELADNGAGNREDGADLHAGEDVRQRSRQLDLAEQRPARAAQRFDQVEQIGLDLAQAARG